MNQAVSGPMWRQWPSGYERQTFTAIIAYPNKIVALTVSKFANIRSLPPHRNRISALNPSPRVPETLDGSADANRLLWRFDSILSTRLPGPISQLQVLNFLKPLIVRD